MFARPKNWVSGGLWKPKNPHSLEHLKYLHTVLSKHQTVTEQNKGLLVETLRSISEILIWGDQNDSSVFDFFLEKNMLAFFLRFMRQKSGRYICVQLLQTLNILFENISNETSVYYLLSNNHINSIIIHKFDFSDEEVMAYYISFLKTLSLKLNKHTIHFFYNEHTNDFALYTEAIKFFNHSETMVRIAVRTITLNVYKACRFTSKLDSEGQPLADEKSMLRYIRDKTAAPYFSNLVYFIGKHVLELDACVRHDIDHNSRGRLSDLVAEHLDHLHYLNDILCLNIDALNEVLTDHLVNHLLIPLYVYSLTKRKRYAPRSDERPHVSSVVSLFLLSQVFLIMHHGPLVRQLADIILNGDSSVCEPAPANSPHAGRSRFHGFVEPVEPLATALDSVRRSGRSKKRTNQTVMDGDSSSSTQNQEGNSTFYDEKESQGSEEAIAQESAGSEEASAAPSESEVEVEELISPNQNSTDEEKLLQSLTGAVAEVEFSLTNRPFLQIIFTALECTDTDYNALFALCLLYAMGHNTGIHQELLDTILLPTQKSLTKDHYNIALVEKIINIISCSCQNGSRVRLATLELSIQFLKTMVYKDMHCFLQDRHLAALEGAREEATLQLRNFYKSEEIFLDMFEDEYREMKSRPLNVEYLTMDASILLPPTGTPLTGIDFNKRLPCGEVERARRAIRVFFHMRDLSLTLRDEQEIQLPLTKLEECVGKGNVLDLNNSDLIACTVIGKENKKERRFLVIDVSQLILVEPDTKRLGWGVVKFVGFLQDIEVTGDKEDSRSLHITIHKPATNMHARPIPLLAARFLFDDHIRCMAAKQRLTKGRLRARQRKMQMIARLLELPTHIVESMYQPSSGVTFSAASLRTSMSSGAIPGRSHPVAQRSNSSGSSDTQPTLTRTHSEVLHRSVFSSVETTPVFTSAQDQSLVTTSRKLPRHLASPRQTTRPIPVRPGAAARQRPIQDNVQRVMEQEGVEMGAAAMDSGVEEAEEATPSPEAHARHSLNQSIIPPPDSRGHHSRSSSTDSNTSRGPIDIPMEDLSKKGKRRQQEKSGSIDCHDFSQQDPLPRRASESVLSDLRRSRSGSSSPLRRKRGSGSGSPHARTKLSSTSGAERPPSRSASTEEKTDSVEVTSFIKANKTNLDKKSKRTKSRTQNTAGASPCPKSLIPATEPALSLVNCDPIKSSAGPQLGSPKLLPPTAETKRIRTFSETSVSTVESEQTASVDGSSSTGYENTTVNSDNITNCTPESVPSKQSELSSQSETAPANKPPFTTSQAEATIGESNITAQVQRVLPSGEESSKQLHRLAQMVDDVLVENISNIEK